MNDNETLLQIICDTYDKTSIYNNQEQLMKLIPELRHTVGMNQYNSNHCYDVWGHTIRAIIGIQNNPILRTVMLFHDIGKPSCFTRDENGIGHFYNHAIVGAQMATTIMERLLFDNQTISTVQTLVFNHAQRIQPNDTDVNYWLNKLGKNLFRMLIQVKRADISGKAPSCQTQKYHNLSLLEDKLEEIIALL